MILHINNGDYLVAPTSIFISCLATGSQYGVMARATVICHLLGKMAVVVGKFVAEISTEHNKLKSIK